MCDFYSTVWREVNGGVEMIHAPHNSHSKMIADSGWPVNKPNRKTVVFEAEGDGSKLDIKSLVRNHQEVSENLGRRIVAHYTQLAHALKTGEGFNGDGFFSDVAKFADVWTKAMELGHKLDFSNVTVFPGYIYVQQGATLTAPKLTKSGYIYVQQGATLTAPKLTKSGSIYVHQGATLTAPKLKRKK